MSTTTHSLDATGASSSSTISRLGVLLYGVSTYAIGVASLVGMILIMLGVLEFSGLSVGLSGTSAILVNVGLMVAFALQHGIMARKGFKERLTRVIPVAAERATFMLATGVVLGAALLLWQPMPGVLWDVQTPALRWGLTGFELVGWTYLLLASFAINHFELFGLQQAYQYFRGREVTAVPFKERWMYRFDRHPIMTGVLIGLWVTPQMRVDHLLFALTATLYVVVGVYFEERSLRRQWGATYDEYVQRTFSLVPSFTRPASTR